MEIALKNIYVSERLSKGSTAFDATLYVNVERVGKVANYGQGGAMKYRPRDGIYAELITDAKVWCRGLPPVGCAATFADGKPTVIPMDLDIYLDNMVMEWLRKRDAERFGKRAERHMLSAILFGVPGQRFRVMQYRLPIATMIGTDKGVERLRLDIHQKVLPMLCDHEKILNTNIPAEIIRRLKVPVGKWVDL